MFAHTFVQRSRISRVSAVLSLLAVAKCINAQEWPDPNFNAGFWTPGWQSSFFSLSTLINEEAKAIVRTADGSYIVAGRVPDPDSFVGVDIGLVKYRSDGIVDTSFGGIANVHGLPVPGIPGKVLWDAYSTDVTDMTLDSLGRIIVVGPTPTGPNGDSDFGVVRFLADGSDVDRSFNNGIGGTSVGFNFGGDNDDIPVAVLADEQERVTVLGNVAGSNACGGTSGIGMIRLDSQGELDSTFGNQSPRDGRTSMCINDESSVAGLTLFRGNYAIATTYLASNHTQTGMGILFVDIDGDPSQSSSWESIPLPNGVNLRASAIALQSQPELLIAGNALSNNGDPKSAIVCRVHAVQQGGGYDYLFDPTFGPNCYVSPSTNYDTVSSIAVHSDRSVELVGDFLSPLAYPRGRTVWLNSDGTSPPISAGTWQAPRRVESDGLSFRTSFSRVILDHDDPVVVGYRADDSSSDTDHDFVMLRLKTDLIFADDFE